MTFIIAEAGSNHNCIFKQATVLIDVAVAAKCDAVKFQTFTSETMWAHDTPDFANYTNINKLVKSIELPRHWQKDLKLYCDDHGIEFMSTPFDEQAVDELVELGVKHLKIAGSVDMLFENKDGTLEMYDWKRCKKIDKTNKWAKAKTKCISHLDDCNYNHYLLQLNTYKFLIEKNYGKKITKMYILTVHPNNENENYIRIEVPDLSKDIQNLMKLRKLMLKLDFLEAKKLKIEQMIKQTSKDMIKMKFGT